MPARICRVGLATGVSYRSIRTIDGSAFLGTIICGLRSNLATYLVCENRAERCAIHSLSRTSDTSFNASHQQYKM